MTASAATQLPVAATRLGFAPWRGILSLNDRASYCHGTMTARPGYPACVLPGFKAVAIGAFGTVYRLLWRHCLRDWQPWIRYGRLQVVQSRKSINPQRFARRAKGRQGCRMNSQTGAGECFPELSSANDGA